MSDLNTEIRNYFSLFRKADQFAAGLPKRSRDLQLDERLCNIRSSFITFLFRKKRYKEVLVEGNLLGQKLKRHSEIFLNSLVANLSENMMYAAFYLDDLRTCIRHYNTWYRKTHHDEIARRLFGLIISFESGDLDHLYYRCRSFQYYLRKHHRSSTWEMDILRTLGGDLRHFRPGKKNVHDFISLRKKLMKRKPQLKEFSAKGGFDYLGWVNQKVQLFG